MIKKIFAFTIALGITFGFILLFDRADRIEQRHIAESVPKAKPVVIATTPEPETMPEPEIEPVNLGEFKLTAYCSCSKCCGKWAENRPLDANGNEIVYGASGDRLTAGYSVAVDPTVIPYGTKLLINGQEYEAQDCGGAIKNKRIDVYFNNHADAVQFGVQYADIFLN